LGKAFKTFRATVAIDDSSRGNKTPVVFKVIGDGRVRWSSRPIRKQDGPQACVVDVAGVGKLGLVVECPGGHANAHAVWVDPMVER
jgi:hypothetical protein